MYQVKAKMHRANGAIIDIVITRYVNSYTIQYTDTDQTVQLSTGDWIDLVVDEQSRDACINLIALLRVHNGLNVNPLGSAGADSERAP